MLERDRQMVCDVLEQSVAAAKTGVIPDSLEHLGARFRHLEAGYLSLFEQLAGAQPGRSAVVFERFLDLSEGA